MKLFDRKRVTLEKCKDKNGKIWIRGDLLYSLFVGDMISLTGVAVAIVIGVIIFGILYVFGVLPR